VTGLRKKPASSIMSAPCVVYKPRLEPISTHPIKIFLKTDNFSVLKTRQSY